MRRLFFLIWAGLVFMSSAHAMLELSHKERKMLGTLGSVGEDFIFVTCDKTSIVLPDGAQLAYRKAKTCDQAEAEQRQEQQARTQSLRIRDLGGSMEQNGGVLGTIPPPPCKQPTGPNPTPSPYYDSLYAFQQWQNQSWQSMQPAFEAAEIQPQPEMDGDEVPCDDPGKVPGTKTCPSCMDVIETFVTQNPDWADDFWTKDMDSLTPYYEAMAKELELVVPEYGAAYGSAQQMNKIADDFLLDFGIRNQITNGTLRIEPFDWSSGAVGGVHTGFGAGLGQ